MTDPGLESVDTNRHRAARFQQWGCHSIDDSDGPQKECQRSAYHFDMLTPGEPAPPFELPNQNGEPIALEEFRGQQVVVYFYPRADTDGCTTQACSFRDQWDTYRDLSVPVLGISDDPVEDLAAFASKYDLPFDLLSDETGDVATAYDSYGEKSMFGNTFMGVFRNTYVIGPDGNIELAMENVDPEGHASDLLDTLQ